MKYLIPEFFNFSFCRISVLWSVVLLLSACDGQKVSRRGTDFDLQGWIDKELSQGKDTVVIPPGIYRVKPRNRQHLKLEGLKNITIIAKDVEMICTETTRAVTFKSCENVTLKGLTIDYDPLCFTQGIITDLSPDKSVIEFSLDDGYPDHLVERIEIFDAVTHRLKRDTYYGWSPFEKIGERRYRVKKGKDYRYHPETDKEEIGDILVTNNDYTPGGNEAHAVYSDECAGLTLADITLYSGNCFGFFETNGTGNTYFRCRIDRRPPETDLYERKKRIRSNNADAFHSKFARVGPRLIECSARYQGDDGVNICGKYYMTTGGKENTVRVVAPHGCDLEVGTVLEILTVDGKRLPETRILKIKEGGTITPEETDGILSLNQHDGNKKSLTRPENKIVELTVDTPVTFPLGSLVGDKGRMGSGFLVKNCYFGYNRSRGILIKASDGKVTGNTLDHNRMHAVLVTPEAWWLESGCSDRVEISGNTVIDNGHARAICVTGSGFTGEVPPAGLHHEISVVGNKLTGCYLPAVYIASTQGGRVTGNVVTAPAIAGNGLSRPVVLVTCENMNTDF